MDEQPIKLNIPLYMVIIVIIILTNPSSEEFRENTPQTPQVDLSVIGQTQYNLQKMDKTSHCCREKNEWIYR